MFKINNKNTSKTPILTYFTPCSSVSAVNFERVNVGLERNLYFTQYIRVNEYIK